jgi:site-specific DNA recombinase
MRRPKKTNLRNVVLYVRVSTAEQAEQGLSLPAQRQALERYAADHGYEVLRSYEEAGASGTDDNRPAFRRMTGDLLGGDLAGRVDAILVYMTSRFMRDAMRAKVWKSRLEKAGIRVIATQQDFGTDPMGRLVEAFFESIDEYESAVNGMRTSAAMRESARQGFFPGSRPPFGYRVEKVEVRPGIRRSKLLVDEGEAATLRELFSLYLGGLGAIQVSEALNARGISYRGGRRWTKDRVLRVASDRAATGTYLWARGDEEPVEIRLPAILETETFERAVALRDEREPSKTPGRLTSSPLLLTRVAHCGCGAKLVLETSGKVVAGERPHRYYNCRTTTRVGKSQCAGVRVPEAELDQAVMEHVAERVFSPARCRELLVELLESGEALRERTAEQRKNLKRDLDEVERKIAVWEGHVESGQVPIAVATERLAALRTMREDLKTTLSKVVPLRVPPSSVLAEETVESFRAMMRDSLAEGGPIARTYVRFLVERIDVRRTDDDRREVRISARKGNAMRLMHAATDPGREMETPPGFATRGGVLTYVAGELRDLDSNQGPIG